MKRQLVFGGAIAQGRQVTIIKRDAAGQEVERASRTIPVDEDLGGLRYELDTSDIGPVTEGMTLEIEIDDTTAYPHVRRGSRHGV